jgi:GT2 family glycosyltransferase
MHRPQRLAIIIASKNRPRDIHRALASLGEQTVMADDVVVIDQSEKPYDLSVYPGVRHVHDRSITSLAAARNRGIALVNSPRVLFIDDDVKLRPSTLAALHQAFDNFPDAVGFQCEDLEKHETGRLNGLLESIFEHGFFSRRRKSRGNVVELTALGGFGMAYRSSVFERELFDEGLVGYSFGEDWDFSKRAARHGRLIVAPGADVHHYWSPVNRDNARAICRMRWTNYKYFFTKNVMKPSTVDLLQKRWWEVGETYRWLRQGLGFPSDAKALKR